MITFSGHISGPSDYTLWKVYLLGLWPSIPKALIRIERKSWAIFESKGHSILQDILWVIQVWNGYIFGTLEGKLSLKRWFI